MEKTNSNRTSKITEETTQAANKWLSDSCSIMAHVYDKQFKSAMDFYNNLFQSFSGASKNENEYSRYIPSFFSGNELLTSMMRTFSLYESNGNLLANLILQFEDMYKQTNDFNKNLFTMFQEELDRKPNNITELSEKYTKAAEEYWKTTQNITNSLLDTYGKQLNSALELNKKIIAETNDQFRTALDGNKRFWSDIIKNGTGDSNSETKYTEENKDGQSKKQRREELIHH